MKKIVALILIFSIGIHAEAQKKKLKAGMKIDKSITIRKATYSIPNSSDSALVIIEGDDIVVDFSNATIDGSDGRAPDQFTGLAVLVRNSNRVTIKNLKARGFRIALEGINVESLTLENCDFSYNYRPRLKSSQEKEDIADWMSYHHNEKDEWKRYGAAIYLRNCQMPIIRNCRVTGGQNALMMTECNDGLIYNNDFSFNSGIGMGFYRSSRNKVLYNRVNFNVRGYSHGVYKRGQDSAGMLVYEQSSENLFYMNSVTHGGDGFFLWAGQTTMDTGEGGCNDNLLMKNDFSYAPTNGIEATFSRNKFIDNRIFECDHGIWGGYSYDSDISSNKFRYNRIAIAIEHGQRNAIHHNVFIRDTQAIRLWARAEQPADWGYAQKRNTRSMGMDLYYNSFNQVPLVYNLSMTRGLKIFGNIYPGCGLLFKTDSTVTGIDSTEHVDLSMKYSEDTALVVPLVDNPMNPFEGNGPLAGRKNIWITEWGPYDFRYPVVWNTNPTAKHEPMQFVLKGPAKGKWKLKSIQGLENLSKTSGVFPDTITAVAIPGERTDIRLDLEYRGPNYTDAFGRNVKGRRRPVFSYQKFFQPVHWAVRWYAYDSSHNPVTEGLFPANQRLSPVLTDTTDRLQYAWWGGIRADGNTYPRFITLAEGEAEFEPGEYELGVTWDDAVRVYLDDELIVNEWEPSRYSFDESPHRTVKLKLGGGHRLRVEHVELGGFATLSLGFRKL